VIDISPEAARVVEYEDEQGQQQRQVVLPGYIPLVTPGASELDRARQRLKVTQARIGYIPLVTPEHPQLRRIRERQERERRQLGPGEQQREERKARVSAQQQRLLERAQRLAGKRGQH
jgi:hypothetical protein